MLGKGFKTFLSKQVQGYSAIRLKILTLLGKKAKKSAWIFLPAPFSLLPSILETSPKNFFRRNEVFILPHQRNNKLLEL
jgi:hypothetical protein